MLLLLLYVCVCQVAASVEDQIAAVRGSIAALTATREARERDVDALQEAFRKMLTIRCVGVCTRGKRSGGVGGGEREQGGGRGGGGCVLQPSVITPGCVSARRCGVVEGVTLPSFLFLQVSTETRRGARGWGGVGGGGGGLLLTCVEEAFRKMLTIR